MHIPITSVTPDADPTTILDLFIEKDGSQPGGGSQLERWSSFIGIITAIVGNLLISFALNTQRYAHILIDRKYNETRKTTLNGHLLRPATGYGTEQEDSTEERRRLNLGISDRKGSSDDDDATQSAEESSRRTLQPAFEPRRSKNAREEDADDQGRDSYLKSPYWWLGLVLMIIGEAGNFLAYGFAPASIVSPLGVVALISNCLIAPLMLKERFRRRDLYGVLVAIAGAVTVVLSARTSEEKFGPGELWATIKRWEFLLYVIITLVLIVALMYAEPRYNRRTILVDLGLVGLFGGYTALSTKGVASLLSASLWKAFAYPISYFLAAILILSALMQIRYLNRALQNYDSTQVIPIQFVLFTLSVIIGSAVLYRDFEHTTMEKAIKFIIGCLLTFFGVYLITSKRDEEGDAGGVEQDEDETIQLLDEEAQDVEERTPLRGDTERSVPHAREVHTTALDQDEEPAVAATPRRFSKASSYVPSIAVTPAETPDTFDSNPWLSSTEQINAPPQPRTPQISRLQNESSSTPFFTPATSKPLNRTSSSPADPETPSKRGTPRPPSPDRPTRPTQDDPSPSPGSLIPRSARGSISRLLPMPGPLLAPLSSSLSALVADSLLKGEGAPWSVRASLRRSRSGRHSTDERRRTAANVVSDEENPLDLHFQNRSAEQDLSRARTHEATNTGNAGVLEDSPGPSSGKSKTRLRSLSETLSGMMGRRKVRASGYGNGDGRRRNDFDGEGHSDTPADDAR